MRPPPSQQPFGVWVWVAWLPRARVGGLGVEPRHSGGLGSVVVHAGTRDTVARKCPIGYGCGMTDAADRRAKERARKAAWRARNPERSAALIRRQHAKARANVAAFLCARAKVRAAIRGIPFALTAADIAVSDACPVFGTPLVFGGANGRDNSPSLDRIDPALGYVPGNVRVISYRANRIRSDASLAELRAFVAFLEAAGDV